jgi:hypothetical protein
MSENIFTVPAIDEARKAEIVGHTGDFDPAANGYCLNLPVHEGRYLGRNAAMQWRCLACYGTGAEPPEFWATYRQAREVAS